MDKNGSIEEVLSEIQKLETTTGYTDKWEQLKKRLAEEINFLVTKNFSLLISILYRLDISEKKLKLLLTNPKDKTAGEIIADMIIDRQLQKLESRKIFKSNDVIPEEDKW